MKDLILILDFGGQYNQLIARRVRECNVYSEVWPYTASVEKIKNANPKGIILTGGPSSVYAPNAPKCDPELFSLGVPILGICYGCQLIAYSLGGSVVKNDVHEYGDIEVRLSLHPLFADIDHENKCWMSHTDFISKLPEGFTSIASTDECPIAAYENDDIAIYGVQFHPEVNHTPFGAKLIENFLFEICGCAGDWKMAQFADEYINEVSQKVGNKKVLCALSGGVDSAVSAVLVHKAVGSQLTCIFVDHGLMRKNEGDEVEAVFRDQFNLNLIRLDCEERFLNALKGVTDPERKRKIIGEEFIRVFEEQAKKIGQVDFLVQGTIYPDIIESGVGDAAVIKSHHNVGGLPEVVDFKEILEPLKQLFKDEVRALGRELGIPDVLVSRQPFPGPGLGVRVIGELTKEKLDILREADAIFREEIKLAGLESDINQFFAILADVKSVGVKGDMRTYDYTIVLRAVTTKDFMTAEWAEIPHNVLKKVSSRIVNEVGSINRVVYDITSKPPATIEWE